MKNSLHAVCKTAGLLIVVAALHGCGGGGGHSSSAPAGGGGTTGGSSGAVSGVATPSSVSVVTAQNAGS